MIKLPMMIKIRSKSGAGMIVTALFAAFFILLPLGIFGFELLRFSVAQMQLRSICDASALSGAVGVASTKKGWTPTMAQTEGMKAAYITFRQNVIVGNFLKDICTVHYNDGVAPANPGPNQCIVAYTLLDQNFAPVPTGDPAAKLIRCEAVYGYVPPIGQGIGFTNVPVSAFAEGGLPSLDIVLCYDISGSMDDQTRVSFVKRYYDTVAAKVKYQVVSTNRSGGGLPTSCIYNVQYPTKSGSSVNAVGPQNLSYADFPRPPYESGNAYPYQFSGPLRCDPAFGGSEVGAPPGNQSDPGIPIGGATTFTDMVVNIDGKDVFSGFSDPVSGLNFPNIGVLVEASRGNLDTAAALASSNPGVGVTFDSRYKSTYITVANNLVQPMVAAKQAAGNFYNTMNISANCHFGFIAFSDGIGTDATSTWGTQPGTTKNIVDKAYGQGGTGTYPLPVVKLVKADATTNYDDCRNAVASLTATGKTAIADSLNEAIAQLTVSNGLTRDKARRAIVLFTDGIPNLPGGSVGDDASPAANAAYTAADAAKSGNIPIFCIGLSQNTDIRAVMRKILKKIASKTGGQYYEVTKPEDLDEAFQTIAKSLIVLR